MRFSPDDQTPPYGIRNPFLQPGGGRLPLPLTELAGRLIAELIAEPDLRITEGMVRSSGEPTYRRLDCDRRALCYVRERPKFGVVRVDVSGLWATPRSSPLFHPRTVGQVVLLIRRYQELSEARAYLREVVLATRRSATNFVRLRFTQ